MLFLGVTVKLTDGKADMRPPEVSVRAKRAGEPVSAAVQWVVLDASAANSRRRE